jgi:TonB family protein
MIAKGVRRFTSLAKNSNSQSGLTWSLIGHAALFCTAVLKTWVFPGNVTPYVPVLKVNLVELPDILKKDLHKTQSPQFTQEMSKILKQAENHAEAVKAKTYPKAEKDEMVLHPSKIPEKLLQSKNRTALDRIKALAKIQDIRPALSATDKKELKLLINKGNKLSPGISLSSDAKEAVQANYLDTLRDELRHNWILPAWLDKQSLNARVLIRIDDYGRVQELRMIKASGTPQFDEAVKQAIRQSQPFPAPPRELKSSILSDGILVGFPL